MPFDFFAPKQKVIVGMAHIGALPGSPGYDPRGGVGRLIDAVAADVAALQAGGIDAILFGNEFDRPYALKAPPERIAAMAAVIQSVKSEIRVPFGVNYLWDPVASVAIAVATGARFAREIFSGVFASDMGLWTPDGAGAARLRAVLGRPDLKLMFNVNAEFAHALDARPIALRARSAVFSAVADAILVSGPMTGQPADRSDLARVREAVPDTPLFANTGVTIDNVADVLAIADGAIVGTHLKQDGDTWRPVDGERVKRFMAKVESLR